MLMLRPVRATLAAALLASVAATAAAQSYDPYSMEERLQRIERQLRDLQGQSYQGGGASGGGGPSMDRLMDMENSIRNMTGEVEQLGHEVRTLKDRLDRLETEANFRLNQLEGNPGGAAPGAAGGAGSESGSGASGGGTPAAPSGGGSSGPKTPGSLGDAPAPAANSAAEGLYNDAMDRLTRAEYDEALRLFREIVSTYPDTDYAAQSQYWIADIHYVRKDYEKAALAFAEVLKKYPKTGRGPEAMLKLGISLVNVGKKKEGCTTLGAIKSKYPQASDSILSRADREAKKAGCG